MSVVLIGGSPGTGKTKVAQVLASRLSVGVVNLSDLAESSGCISAYDKARDTGIIDEDCLVEAIEGIVDDLKGQLVIEGHYIDLVPFRSVQAVFMLRTHPEDLKSRLASRGWKGDKVRENVEAEVVGVCQLDAIESFGEELVFEIDTTELSPIQVADEIQKILSSPDEPLRIDWMQLLEEEGRLDEFLSE
ncbi:MAG: hypothetical protein EAX95_06835 [Candidatus Thorarchaeota archaeon]|nr:hypothetical protein [Candidatus Thorarchaeota archaeon]